eukprot:TRINITY_DN4204_c0_g1_i1.p1 TRINITY_DN4204_c0_g1~~TRINITY_DN4204_c0_g1_i1.p1  ORF type:complete len:1324 (+),score=309.14 TRINITY_DN4204_c0_g1_i1:84-4055(+)
MEREDMPLSGVASQPRLRRLFAAGLCLVFAGAAITIGVAAAVDVNAKLQAMHKGVAARRLLVDMSEDQAQARVTMDLEVSPDLKGVALHELQCDLKLPCSGSSSLCSALQVEAVEINKAQVILEVPATADVRALYRYAKTTPGAAQIDCSYTAGLRVLGDNGPVFVHTGTSTWPLSASAEKVKFGHTVSNYQVTPSGQTFHVDSEANGFIHAEVPAGPHADFIMNFLEKTDVQVLADLSYSEMLMDTFQFSASTRGSLSVNKSSSGGAVVSIPVGTRGKVDMRALATLAGAVVEGESTGSDATDHFIMVGAKQPRSWMARVLGAQHKTGLMTHGQPAVRRLKELARELSGKDKIQRGIFDTPFSSFRESFSMYVDQEILLNLDLTVLGGDINKVIIGTKNTYYGNECSGTGEWNENPPKSGNWEETQVCESTETNVTANITMDIELDKEKISGKVTTGIEGKKNGKSNTFVDVAVDYMVDFPNMAMELDVDLGVGESKVDSKNSLKVTADLDGAPNGNKGSANVDVDMPILQLPKMTATWLATETSATTVSHAVNANMPSAVYDVDARKIYPAGFALDKTSGLGSEKMQFRGDLKFEATMTEDKSVAGMSQMEVTAWVQPTCEFVPLTSNSPLSSAGDTTAAAVAAAATATCADCRREEWDSTTETSVCVEWDDMKSCCQGILTDMHSIMNKKEFLMNKSSMNITDGGNIQMGGESPLDDLLGSSSGGDMKVEVKELAGYWFLTASVPDTADVTFKFKSLTDMSLDVVTAESLGSLVVDVDAKTSDQITSLTAAMHAGGNQLFGLSVSGNEGSSTSSKYDLKVSGSLSAQEGEDGQQVFQKIADISLDTAFPRDLISVDSAGAFHLADAGKMTLSGNVKDRTGKSLVALTGNVDTVETASASKFTGAFDISSEGKAVVDIDVSLEGDRSKYDVSITENLLASEGDAKNPKPIAFSGTLSKASDSWSGDMSLSIPSDAGQPTVSVIYISELSNGFLPASYDPEYGRLSMKAELGSQGAGLVADDKSKTMATLQWYLERSPYGDRMISGVGMGVTVSALDPTGKVQFSLRSDTDLGMVVTLPVSPSGSTGGSVGSVIQFENKLTVEPDKAADFDVSKYIEGMKAAIAAEGNSADSVTVEKVEYRTQVAYSVPADMTEAAAKTAFAAAAKVEESAVEVKISKRRRALEAVPRQLASSTVEVTITTEDKTKVAGIAADLKDTAKVATQMKAVGVEATPEVIIEPSVVVQVTTKVTAAAGGVVAPPADTTQSTKLAEQLGITVQAVTDTSSFVVEDFSVSNDARPAACSLLTLSTCFLGATMFSNFLA